MAAPDVVEVGRRRHGLATAVAGLLLLALVAAIAAVLALRQEDSREDAKARRELAAAVFTVTTVGVATDHRVALVLSLHSGLHTKVVGASVSGDGWQAVHADGVGLVRQVDCRTAPPLPLTADATVELHGQRRQVDLLTDPGIGDVVLRTGREACGDVDARRALALKASGTIRVPGGLQLALAVTNKSAHPVLLRRVSVGRLHLVTSKPLPMRLAPHTTVRLIAVIDARGCGASAPVVGLSIQGQGGAAFVTVASADLPQLADLIRAQRHCR